MDSGDESAHAALHLSKFAGAVPLVMGTSADGGVLGNDVFGVHLVRHSSIVSVVQDGHFHQQSCRVSSMVASTVPVQSQAMHMTVMSRW